MRLLLVTHAETDWTAERRFQGHTDIPLNATGRQQAAALQQSLAHEPLQTILSSDLSRAWQTAEILAVPLGLTVQRDSRLRELSFGTWEGLTYAEVQQIDPEKLKAWQNNPVEAIPPQGESLASLSLRLQSVIDELLAQTDNIRLIVAHRGCLRVLLCLLLGVNASKQWGFHLDVASLTEVEIVAGNAKIVRLNKTFERQGDLT